MIYLSAPALTVLDGIERHESNPFVIVGREPMSHLVNLRKPWSRIRKQAGLEDLRLHDLRHSFASIGAGLGISLPIIGKMLGHTPSATTQRYAHLADDPVKEATDKIGERIAAALMGQLTWTAVTLSSKFTASRSSVPTRFERGWLIRYVIFTHVTQKRTDDRFFI